MMAITIIKTLFAVPHQVQSHATGLETMIINSQREIASQLSKRIKRKPDVIKERRSDDQDFNEIWISDTRQG